MGSVFFGSPYTRNLLTPVHATVSKRCQGGKGRWSQAIGT